VRALGCGRYHRGITLLAVSGIVARVFAVWTAVTCLVTVVCAFSLDSETVVLTTVATFVMAFVFFFMELVVFKSMQPRNLVGPGIVSTVSATWLLLHWWTALGGARRF
jgi:hypothetical protein